MNGPDMDLGSGQLIAAQLPTGPRPGGDRRPCVGRPARGRLVTRYQVALSGRVSVHIFKATPTRRGESLF
jgi:hypothetical protein